MPFPLASSPTCKAATLKTPAEKRLPHNQPLE